MDLSGKLYKLTISHVLRLHLLTYVTVTRRTSIAQSSRDLQRLRRWCEVLTMSVHMRRVMQKHLIRSSGETILYKLSIIMADYSEFDRIHSCT